MSNEEGNALLAELEAAGLSLVLRAEGLALYGTDRGVIDEWRPRIRAKKAEIRAWLEGGGLKCKVCDAVVPLDTRSWDIAWHECTPRKVAPVVAN